jgi:hypothetical protein
MSSDLPNPPGGHKARSTESPEWPDFEEAQQMSDTAQTIVNDFDFDAARRFIMNRARQFRLELRMYLASGALLLVFWGAERFYGETDRLTLVIDLMLAFVIAFAVGRLVHLRGLRASDATASIRDRAEREARRVRRERVFNAAMIIVYLLAMALICFDAIAEGSWYWAAVFALLGAVLIAVLRQYAGRSARARAELYIAGDIDAPSYLRGRDGAGNGPNA